MATITIKNGTTVGTESLCNRCRHGHRQKGFRECEELVFCTYMWRAPRMVPFKVAECSHFSERDRMTLWEMEDMALIINPSPTLKPAGFFRITEEEIAAVAFDPETINK